MRRPIPMLLGAAVVAAFSLAAAARGGGFSRGDPVGPASRSGQAVENANGRFAQDRDQGLSRAEDRRSAAGERHEKATAAHKKRHHESAATTK